MHISLISQWYEVGERVIGNKVRLEFTGSEPEQFGQVSGPGDLVVRINDSRAWIRIEVDGRYSHRIYLRNCAAMSYGICQRKAGFLETVSP